MLINVFFAAVATLAFSITFNVRGINLLFTGVVGGISWLAYSLVLTFDNTIILAFFIASATVTIVSEILSKHLKTPVTTFLISGLIPLVPGSGIYYSLYYMVTKNTEKAFSKSLETLFILGALSFGIVIVSSFYRLYETREKSRYFREYNKKLFEKSKKINLKRNKPKKLGDL